MKFSPLSKVRNEAGGTRGPSMSSGGYGGLRGTRRR